MILNCEISEVTSIIMILLTTCFVLRVRITCTLNSVVKLMYQTLVRIACTLDNNHKNNRNDYFYSAIKWREVITGALNSVVKLMYLILVRITCTLDSVVKLMYLFLVRIEDFQQMKLVCTYVIDLDKLNKFIYSSI